MKVGNDAGRDDIVYTTIVGENKPGSVKISDNSIHITGNNVDKKVDISNHPFSVNASVTGRITTKSFFYIEPGKCFYSDIVAKSVYNRRVTLSSTEMCSISKHLYAAFN